MKTQTKINLFMFMMLASLEIPLVIAGYIAINKIVYNLNQEMFNNELLQIRKEITRQQQTLEEMGVATVENFIQKSQTDLLKELRQYKYGRTGFLYILDPHLQVILHKDYQPGEQFNFDFAKEMLTHQQGNLSYYYDEQPYFAVFSISPEWNWLLVLSITEEEIFEHRTNYLHFAGLLSFLLFSLILLLSYLLTRNTSHKIKTTLSFLKEVETGHLEARIPVVNHDEIALIQTGINSMIAKVETATASLRIAYQMAEQAKQEADLANRAKSAFLANMSHELRTPLNGILGFAQILGMDDNLTDDQREGIDIIQRSGEHLLNLINDILDLSKIEAGKVELCPSEFSLDNLLSDILELFKVRTQQKGITFTLQPLSPLPMIVYGDEKRLRQILINLIGNAVKFTERGGVTLKVSCLEMSPTGSNQTSNSKIRFQIEDTGIGMTAADLKQIFLPFQQAGDSNYRAQGTGLGLSITKRLVDMMSGELHVESTFGKGSTFEFTLVLPILSDSQKPSEGVDTSLLVGFEGLPRKVLIVDDHPENRLVLVNLLSPLGFELQQAGHGKEALEKMQTWQPDLILTDLVMPVMDGFELAKAVRSHPNFQGVMMIAVSANVFETNRQKSIDAGYHDFLPKPIRADQLLELLRKHLSLTWIYAE